MSDNEPQPKRIVVVGYALIAFAFVCLFAIAIIAVLEGQGGIGVDYRATGRGAFFTPVVYLPLFAGLVLVAALWALRRVSRKPPDKHDHQ